MAIHFISEIESLDKKRVIARFDFNVPLDENGNIRDTSRVDKSLETIKFLLEKGASKLILMSHLGRPKGVYEQKFSLEPVATYLAEKLQEDVLLTESATDNGLKEFLNLPNNKIILLENLRFHPEEKKDDSEFAKKLASYADIYVNDAFGVSHRKEASVHEIVRSFPRANYAGFLVEKEMKALDKILKNPAKPFVAIIGGAKVSDKIKTIEKFILSVDKLLIGGAMAYPFLKAKGLEVGKSLCSDEDVILAQAILKRDRGNKIVLPVDHICSSSLEGEPREYSEIPSNLMGLDIGEKTLLEFSQIIKDAKTIFWNGPMGLFEKEQFSHGTMKLAKIISETNAYSVVGGGDSVNAIKKSGLAEKFSHISTGGGASIEYIEQGSLPALNALKFGVS